MLPPVPLHPRIVAEDSELAGHQLPAGSEIFLSIFHMHHDPDVFPEPDAFRPRRWETAKPSVYEYNPFSAGPRMCIGASFATMEIESCSPRCCSASASTSRRGARRSARGDHDGPEGWPDDAPTPAG